MYRKVIFFLFILFFIHKTYTEESLPENDTIIYLDVTTEQQSGNTLHIKKEKRVHCSKLHGNPLKECIHSLPNKKRKKILLKYSPQKRTAYINTLTKDEFLSLFLASFSEDEWTNFKAQLSPEEQDRWPNSLQEQKDTLKEIKDRCNDAYAWDATKTAFLYAVLLAPIPLPLSAVVTGCEVSNKREKSLQKEEEDVKKYIKEKYG